MQRLVQLITLLVFFGISSTILAEPPKKPGSEIIDLEMGMGLLRFTHWKHQGHVNNDCLVCHDGDGFKIKAWGEVTAHKICIPCHEQSKKGDVKCQECHMGKVISPSDTKFNSVSSTSTGASQGNGEAGEK